MDEENAELLSELISNIKETKLSQEPIPKVSSFSLQDVVTNKFKQFTFRKSDTDIQSEKPQILQNVQNHEEFGLKSPVLSFGKITIPSKNF